MLNKTTNGPKSKCSHDSKLNQVAQALSSQECLSGTARARAQSMVWRWFHSMVSVDGLNRCASRVVGSQQVGFLGRSPATYELGQSPRARLEEDD